MASWSPGSEARRAHHDRGVLRLGGHLVRDAQVLDLADRLVECEHRLANRPLDDRANETPDGRRLLDATRACVARDLEVLSAALERSGVASA
jgi:hypothetical protein